MRLVPGGRGVVTRTKGLQLTVGFKRPAFRGVPSASHCSHVKANCAFFALTAASHTRIFALLRLPSRYGDVKLYHGGVFL